MSELVSFTRGLLFVMPALIASAPLSSASADDPLGKSALAQAKIIAAAMEAGRLDIVATMTPATLQDVWDATSGLSAYAEAENQVTSVTVGPVLSVAELDGESFATIATEMQMSVEGDLVIVRGYLFCVSPDGGRKWDFINGSTKMEKRVSVLSKQLADRLVFPTCRMVLGETEFRKQDGKWVLEHETRERMKELLREANTNE